MARIRQSALRTLVIALGEVARLQSSPIRDLRDLEPNPAGRSVNTNAWQHIGLMVLPNIFSIYFALNVALSAGLCRSVQFHVCIKVAVTVGEAST